MTLRRGQLVNGSLAQGHGERSRTMKAMVIFALKFYRNYLSIFKLRCCRFYPSCSEYAINSIEKHGLIFGIIKSVWRVLRCNPFSKGGYDPVRPYGDNPSNIQRSNGTIRYKLWKKD